MRTRTVEVILESITHRMLLILKDTGVPVAIVEPTDENLIECLNDWIWDAHFITKK